MIERIQSNRDLYSVVTSALKPRRKSSRNLEVYLTRLRELIVLREGGPMSGDEFAALLDAAFVGPAPRTDLDALREVAADERMPAWHRKLAQQIVDLREMAEDGTLEYEYRYFGVNAPSGARWYNFDPHTFIECGLTGSFGGWDPSADTSRALVPGKVAVMGSDGKMCAVDPAEILDPAVELGAISWEDIAEFLWAGQCYE